MSEPVFEAVGLVDDLAPGARRVVTVGPQQVLLVNHEGCLYAVPNSCPHRNWPLSQSTQRDAILECARHGWQFDLVSGRGVWPPFGYRLRHLPVRVVDGTIHVAWTEPEIELAH